MAQKIQKALDTGSKAKTVTLQAAASFAATSPRALEGHWLNCDPKTRGVEAVFIPYRRKRITVYAWGSCSPKWCNWGAAKPAIAYSASVSSAKAIAFTARWDFKFAEVLMTGTFCEGCLKIQTFTRFKDGSKRFDYHSSDCFYRVDRREWAVKTKGKLPAGSAG